ncbi:hypothetical protein AMJ80_12795 [bacterium SM23_31]|nr:MAG: hypothetical protein AMJ80_12795 [bacterium SM23_31]
MKNTRHRKLSFEELQQRSQTLESLNRLPRMPIYVILENIRSLFNVGSIFRTADGLRAARIILTGYTGRPPRKEIDKASLGAVEAVPWTSYDDTKNAVLELRNKGIYIIALEQTEDSVDFQKYRYRFPAAVILGNEYDGIKQDTLELCDACVTIPMLGIKQSLNVGTAFGIIGYEMYRQYSNVY